MLEQLGMKFILLEYTVKVLRYLYYRVLCYIYSPIAMHRRPYSANRTSFYQN